MEIRYEKRIFRYFIFSFSVPFFLLFSYSGASFSINCLMECEEKKVDMEKKNGVGKEPSFPFSFLLSRTAHSPRRAQLRLRRKPANHKVFLWWEGRRRRCDALCVPQYIIMLLFFFFGNVACREDDADFSVLDFSASFTLCIHLHHNNERNT